MSKEWNESNFFSTAQQMRENILKSNNPKKYIEVQILCEIVSQVFLTGKLPSNLKFTPPPKLPREEFHASVCKILKKLGLKYELSKKFVSTSCINTYYNYTASEKNNRS